MSGLWDRFYTNDALGRRTGVALSGTAFHPTNDPAVSLSYPYNDRSEVTGATRVVNGGATWSWAYAYDPAGNRVQMSENQGTALTTSYLTNGVNQYHWTDRPAAGTKPRVRQNLDYDGDGNLVEAYVVGDVNCDAAFDSFDTDAFALAVSDPQEYAQQYPSCNILNADINGDGSVNGFDTDAFTDLLTSGGNSGAVWEAYAWDGENRLVEVRPGSASPPSGSKKTTFAYDFVGRRIGKKVYNRTAGGVWNLTQDRQYVYDGWNLLLELDATQSGSPAVRQHTWGLDLAGQNVAQSPSAGNVAQSPSAGNVAQSPSAVTADAAAGLHAAGGVGGLLATHDAPGGQPTRDFVHFYDANGNVTQLIDLSSGAAAAKYEYDAFGNELVRTGTFAASNRFRFSTKYTDANTDFAGEGTDGLSHYGYRYYSPRLGRWMSRDPIGEWGGLNLYGFVGNDPANAVDPLGEEVRKKFVHCRDRLVIYNEYYDWFGNYCGVDICKIPKGTRCGPTMATACENAANRDYRPWYDCGIDFSCGFLSAAFYTAGGAAEVVCHPVQTCESIGAAYDQSCQMFENDGCSTDEAVARTLAVGLAHALALNACANVAEGTDASGNTLSAFEYGENCFQIGATYGPATAAAGRCIARGGSQARTIEILKDVARRAEQKIPGCGGRVGTLRHSYAKRLLERYQSRHGEIGEGLNFELSYRGGISANYGKCGSVRLYVVEGPIDCPIAVYDFKFGSSCLTALRISRIRAETGFQCPILEIKP
ncbi:MAG: hypothetical protein CHACPFDD_03105 [Phycisphaerae bacterium]|nr:hypothetical protein [Phycisphaerae bacterium]